MKRSRVAGVILAVLLLGAIFTRYLLDRNLRELDFSPLAGLLEAGAGRVVTGRIGADKGGLLEHYEAHPAEMQRDRKTLETFNFATALATAAQERAPVVWTSSASVDWIRPSDREDAWGHAFCVQSDARRVLVVSPGPDALASLDCGTLRIPEMQLNRMRRGLFNVQPSGALVLVVERTRP